VAWAEVCGRYLNIPTVHYIISPIHASELVMDTRQSFVDCLLTAKSDSQWSWTGTAREAN